MIEWPELAGFDWDAGNSEKNWRKHRVSDDEAEGVFFNRPLAVRADQPSRGSEPRYYGLGQTDRGRALFVAFTIRGRLIRVISARDMSQNERRIYAQYEKGEEKDDTWI